MTRPVNQPVLAGPRASRQPLAIRCRDNSHNALGRHRLIVAEIYHELSDDFPDQPGLIALVADYGGVEPFHFIDFHSLHGGFYGD